MSPPLRRIPALEPQMSAGPPSSKCATAPENDPESHDVLWQVTSSHETRQLYPSLCSPNSVRAMLRRRPDLATAKLESKFGGPNASVAVRPIWRLEASKSLPCNRVAVPSGSSCIHVSCLATLLRGHGLAHSAFPKPLDKMSEKASYWRKANDASNRRIPCTARDQ